MIYISKNNTIDKSKVIGVLAKYYSFYNKKTDFLRLENISRFILNNILAINKISIQLKLSIAESNIDYY